MKEDGHHHSPNGKIVINSFLDQVNNNRLSTNVKTRVNRELLISQAKLMLEVPSNYEKVGGRTSCFAAENKWLPGRKPGGTAFEILDVNGNVIKTCPSISAIMELLDVSRYIVLKRKLRVEDGKSILWLKENQLIYIREVLV